MLLSCSDCLACFSRFRRSWYSVFACAPSWGTRSSMVFSEFKSLMHVCAPGTSDCTYVYIREIYGYTPHKGVCVCICAYAYAQDVCAHTSHGDLCTYKCICICISCLSSRLTNRFMYTCAFCAISCAKRALLFSGNEIQCMYAYTYMHKYIHTYIHT